MRIISLCPKASVRLGGTQSLVVASCVMVIEGQQGSGLVEGEVVGHGCTQIASRGLDCG